MYLSKYDLNRTILKVSVWVQCSVYKNKLGLIELSIIHCVWKEKFNEKMFWTQFRKGKKWIILITN